MAMNAAQVRVFGSGEVYLAPAETAMPVSLTTDPASPWEGTGLITTDGLTLSFGRETTDLFAWQSLDPVRTVKTSEPKTAAFTLMESDLASFMLAIGGGEIVESGTDPDFIYTYTPPPAGYVDERAMLIDLIDGTFKYRWYFPRVINKETVEMKAVNDDAFSFPITMSVLKPSTGDVFKYVTNDAANAAA